MLVAHPALLLPNRRRWLVLLLLALLLSSVRQQLATLLKERGNLSIDARLDPVAEFGVGGRIPQVANLLQQFPVTGVWRQGFTGLFHLGLVLAVHKLSPEGIRRL